MDDLLRRRAAWEALSELFLDTEPDPAFIARQLRGTDYSAAALDAILRGEVAPVLGGNLLSAAGVWSGFDLAPVEARYAGGRRLPALTGWLACRVIRRDWECVLEWL